MSPCDKSHEDQIGKLRPTRIVNHACSKVWRNGIYKNIKQFAEKKINLLYSLLSKWKHGFSHSAVHTRSRNNEEASCIPDIKRKVSFPPLHTIYIHYLLRYWKLYSWVLNGARWLVNWKLDDKFEDMTDFYPCLILNWWLIIPVRKKSKSYVINQFGETPQTIHW